MNISCNDSILKVLDLYTLKKEHKRRKTRLMGRRAGMDTQLNTCLRITGLKPYRHDLVSSKELGGFI